MSRRARIAFVLVFACIAATFSTALASTAVHNLRPALLTGSLVPHGFSSNSYKLFSSLVKNMPVAGKTCGTQSIRRSDWKQGLHQVFQKPWPPSVDVDDLEVCGYLFTTTTLASGNFRQTQTTALNAAAKGITRALHTPPMGDGVVAGISPFKAGTGGYFLIFYYRNALLSLTYIYHRKPFVTPSSFVHMAAGMAARLEKGR